MKSLWNGDSLTGDVIFYVMKICRKKFTYTKRVCGRKAKFFGFHPHRRSLSDHQHHP